MASDNWTFLTNHGVVYLHLVDHSGDTIPLIADQLGLAEPTVAGIVADLREAEYVVVGTRGKQDVYSINLTLPMRHPVVADYVVGDVFPVLAKRRRREFAEKGPVAVRL